MGKLIILILLVCSNTQNICTQTNLKNAYKLRQEVIFNLDNYLKYDHIVVSQATVNNIDPNIIRAVIVVESKYNPKAKSTAKAMGLMQLTPITLLEVNIGDPYCPEEAIKGGTLYLSKLLDRFNSIELALAAYHAGPSVVVRYKGVPPYKSTKGYIKLIKRVYKILDPKGDLL